MTNELYIYHHLGLGDHIVCHGLVRHYCKQFDTVYLFVKPHNHDNVQYMYNDLENLKLIAGDDTYANNYISKVTKYLKIGFNAVTDVPWDIAFYKQVGLDFNLSWDLFHIRRDLGREQEAYRVLNPNNKPYIFVHGHSIGQTIPKVQIEHDLIIGPDARFKFFDFISILENAEEVHCVNSSFLHLVDRIKTNGKLFYHSCRNPIDMITLRKNWN